MVTQIYQAFFIQTNFTCPKIPVTSETINIMGINYNQPRVSLLDKQVDILDEHYIEGGNQKEVYAMYKQKITQNRR